MEDIALIRMMLHYGMHFILPFLIALIFYRERWLPAGLVMFAANFVDLDHLLADPIFDPGRCSIGFHLLHSYYAIAIYFLLLLIPRLRWLAIGLLLHMAVDLQDCFWIWGLLP